MEQSTFTILLFTILVFAMTPGPGTLALLSISTTRDFLSSMTFSVGLIIGDLSYLSLVVFSIDVLAEQIAPLIGIVRFFGAAYLMYLGYSQWTSGVIKLGDFKSNSSNKKDFIAGFVISGTNPKVMIFYLSVLPVVIDLTQVKLSYALQIILTVALGLLTGLVVISLLGKQLKRIINSPNSAQLVNRISGTILFLVGVSLVFL
ncbi:MAG TPA: LysE family translocator [Gammaproteobacteria bacterium]|jgi:threonine/homoserine/homoserine lactone efflux protein|nr:LysE family translocator [Gammaproteobacteria bacterium]